MIYGITDRRRKSIVNQEQIKTFVVDIKITRHFHERATTE